MLNHKRNFPLPAARPKGPKSLMIIVMVHSVYTKLFRIFRIFRIGVDNALPDWENSEG